MPALPRFSDIDLLGYDESVIDLDSEIADRALDLRVAQQELNRPKISLPSSWCPSCRRVPRRDLPDQITQVACDPVERRPAQAFRQLSKADQKLTSSARLVAARAPHHQ